MALLQFGGDLCFVFSSGLVAPIAATAVQLETWFSSRHLMYVTSIRRYGKLEPSNARSLLADRAAPDEGDSEDRRGAPQEEPPRPVLAVRPPRAGGPSWATAR